MSTGDQSEYMRGKMAERGASQGVQFSKDGFDRWAESTAPARAGQMEKEPAETQMVRTGGAMSVAEAKKFAEKIAKKYGQSVTDMVESYKGGAMCGGRSFLGIEIPEIVEKALDYGEKVLKFALLLKDKLPEIKQAIQEEIIDNDDDPSITANDKATAKAMLPILDDILKYLNMLQNIKNYADIITNALKGSGLRGGAAQTSAQKFQAAVKYLGEKAQQLLGYVSFFTKNAPFLKQMLRLRPLRPYGQQILDKINPILALVGLGKGGRRKQTCECSDSEEYRGPSRKPMRGGFFPGMENMFGQQKQEATMMPMQGDYGMMQSGYKGMQSGYKGSPMGDDGGMQMDNYDMSTGKYESTVAARPSSEAAAQVEGLRRKIKQIDESDMSSKDKREMVKKLEKQIQDLEMRGGAADPELIKRIKAEINRLKNMRQDGARATATKRKIESLEAQLQELEMRGGFFSRLSRRSPVKRRGGMEMMESVNYGRDEKNDEMIKLQREFKEKARNLSPAERKKLEKHYMELAKELQMRGGTVYRPTTSSSRPRKPDDTVVTSRAVGGRKPSARGAIVKKVMKERGLSLPEASRYVKENGLY